MTGKVQDAVLEYLETGGAATTQDIAAHFKVCRHRATQILTGLESGERVIRVSETRKRNNKTITWRVPTDDEILRPNGKAMFPPSWPRVDPIVWGAVKAMCEVRS